MNLSGHFDTIDLKLAKRILFERVLWDIYYHLALSPAKETKRQWYLHKGDIRSFLNLTSKKYDSLMGKKPIEVVEVVAAPLRDVLQPQLPPKKIEKKRKNTPQKK